MFVLLGISAIPIISQEDFFIIIFGILLSVWFYLNNKESFDKVLFIIIGAIFVIILAQSFLFSFFKIYTILGLLLRIWVAYLCVKYLKEKFIFYFDRLIYFFSIVSFFVFVPIYIYPKLLVSFSQMIPEQLSINYQLWGNTIYKKSIILYHFNMVDSSNIIRNCGPFWEPAVFGGFLILALVYNTNFKDSLINKKNWVYMIAIITTQSTTAYLALFIFIVIYLLLKNKALSSKIALVVFLLLGLYLFNKVDILSSKISKEYTNIKNDVEIQGGNSRMASAFLDLIEISEFPLTGRGIWDETRVDKKKFEFVKRNNGLSNLAAQWGLIFFTIYFYYFHKGLKIFCDLTGSNKYMSILILIVVWVLSFSENYYSLPFFWALMFLHIPLSERLFRKYI